MRSERQLFQWSYSRQEVVPRAPNPDKRRKLKDCFMAVVRSSDVRYWHMADTGVVRADVRLSEGSRRRRPKGADAGKSTNRSRMPHSDAKIGKPVKPKKRIALGWQDFRTLKPWSLFSIHAAPLAMFWFCDSSFWVSLVPWLTWPAS
jgi:hypothetical protein